MTQRQQPPEKRKRVFTPAESRTRDTESHPASTHRAGHFAGLHAEDMPYTTTADVREYFKRPAYKPDELEASNRITAISRRYNGIPTDDGVIVPDANGQDGWYFHKSPVPRRARATRGDTTEAPNHLPKAKKPRRRLHWLFFVGSILLVMLIGAVVFNALGSWWQNHQNDATYGYPRTFQTDAVVGHNDSPAHPSHFIALNLRGHMLILEIPGGNASKAIIYAGPVLLGPGQDTTPVTLSFADTTGNGKLDMLVHIDTSTLVFLNNGTRFVPPSNLASGESTLPTVGA